MKIIIYLICVCGIDSIYTNFNNGCRFDPFHNGCRLLVDWIIELLEYWNTGLLDYRIIE